MAEKSIAKLVWDYITTHLSIHDCLNYGLINYSALTRKIMQELGIEKKEAVLAACKRYPRERKQISEKEVLNVLGKSKLEIRNKIGVLIAPNSWHLFPKLEVAMRQLIREEKELKVIQGSLGITIITTEDLIDELKELIGKENILSERKGLVEISVTSPRTIEETRGIIAHLSSALATNGINIVETMSCYTDTIFILEEKDMVKGFEVLNKCMGGKSSKVSPRKS
jgi:hypothetical protein